MLSLSSGTQEYLQPVPSLWRMIEEQLVPSERAEVKTILGDNIVEHNMELHTEVQILMEFYQELQLDLSRTEETAGQAADKSVLLAAPPHLKELVREEIRLLLIGLQQKALQEGRDQNYALDKYNPCVVTFALKGNAGNSRPSSGSNAFIRPLSSRNKNDLEPYYEQLTVTHVEEISSRLRTLLKDECHALEKYITYLQNQLEEMHLRATDLRETIHEPTMAELQEEKRAMERDLQISQPELCPNPHLMSKQFGNSTYWPQLSHPKGSGKGPSIGQTSPASNGQIRPASNGTPSSDPRDQAPPLCSQPSPRWNHSTKAPLGWIQHQDSNQAKTDSDIKMPKTLGEKTTSTCRVATPTLETAFLPKPPTEPCPLSRFCPRARLLRCKGPS